MCSTLTRRGIAAQRLELSGVAMLLLVHFRRWTWIRCGVTGERPAVTGLLLFHFYRSRDELMRRFRRLPANKPAAPNPAIASRWYAEHHSRAVREAER